MGRVTYLSRKRQAMNGGDVHLPGFNSGITIKEDLGRGLGARGGGGFGFMAVIRGLGLVSDESERAIVINRE